MWYRPTGKEKRYEVKKNRKNSYRREARGRPRGTPFPSKEFCDTLYLVTRKISIVLRRSGDGPGWDRLGTGLQAMQLSPHHAGLAGLQIQHLLSASRFAAMLLSPSLSASSEAADL